MPLACKIYELVGVRTEDAIRALELNESVATIARTSYSGFIFTFKLPDGSPVRIEICVFRGRTFLIVLAGRRRAEKAAKLIANAVGAGVTDAEVDPLRFMNLFKGSVVKVAVFDMVRKLGLRRVVLAGDAVSDTDLYKEFAESYKIRYVLFQTGEGSVLGISDSGSLVVLSRITEEDILRTVKETLLPLIVPLS